MEKKEKDKKPKKMDEVHLLGYLKECYELGKQYYAKDHKRMQMLDQTDKGNLWKAINANFPPYQILPDTNYVSYVKDNILASLYTTAKSAEVRPTSQEDGELCTKLNLILDNIWDTQDVGYKQFQAGERAALLNLGITQVGWDEDYMEGVGDFAQKGRVTLKNVDPMNFMRDPFAENLYEGSWCCTWDRLHESVIRSNPHYKEAFEKWEHSTKRTYGSEETPPSYGEPQETNHSDKHYNVFKFWIRSPKGRIDEIHCIDQSVLLWRKEDIKPNIFPFALLYCNNPGKGLVGVSPAAKIFANNVAYNMMVSLALTAEYRNQRPPRFISASSGINIPAFTMHGAEADRTFVVQQDASQAVHYAQFPEISGAMPNILTTLSQNIQDSSGVDGRYTGRDTGSIITTGGTEEMLNRVTIIDAPKVCNYEHYTRDLSMLIINYMIEYAPKRKYFVKNPTSPKWKTVEIDFPSIDRDTLFSYSLSISSELPKNKQRIAAWADAIMEKQMQYSDGGNQVELLSPEEWLMLQDVPFKEMLLERMGYERDVNAVMEASNVIMQYANLIEQGVSPGDALALSAQGLEAMRNPSAADPMAALGMQQGFGPEMGAPGTMPMGTPAASGPPEDMLNGGL